MTDKQVDRALTVGVWVALAVAIFCTLAFGVFDIQCGGEGEWSALRQTCIPFPTEGSEG